MLQFSGCPPPVWECLPKKTRSRIRQFQVLRLHAPRLDISQLATAFIRTKTYLSTSRLGMVPELDGLDLRNLTYDGIITKASYDRLHFIVLKLKWCSLTHRFLQPIHPLSLDRELHSINLRDRN